MEVRAVSIAPGSLDPADYEGSQPGAVCLQIPLVGLFDLADLFLGPAVRVPTDQMAGRKKMPSEHPEVAPGRKPRRVYETAGGVLVGTGFDGI